MSTVSAKQFVNVVPGTLGAGGSGLSMAGLVLTTNPRVPIGTVMPFANATAVQNFFGSTSKEAIIAGGGNGLGSGYFGGFTNAPQTPATINFAQYPLTAVGAYLRGGNISALSLSALQAISGALDVVIDGYPRNGTINLNSATSFSSAASIIESALNSADPTEFTGTGTIGASFTGSIASTTLTVSAVSAGVISIGDVITTGASAGTTITAFGSGSGGTGTYTVSNSQTVSSTSMTTSSNVLDISAIASGTVAAGQSITGTGITETVITGQLSGTTGGVGAYSLAGAQQTVGSETVTGVGTPVTVSYDSVSGAFVVSSGLTGVGSTAAFATGATAASLLLTSATGAVLSQGAAAATPGAFMDALVQVTQNWACFMLAFDPDGGSGNTQKLAFAAWTNAQDDQYAFICWDTDASPTTTVPATSSLGYLLQQNQYSGTFLIWEPSDLNHAAFVLGVAPSINFSAANGRWDYDYLSQSGLTAAVTTDTVYENLSANGYNMVVAVGSATENFIFLTPGSVLGPFEWMDSYINQIFFNNQFQNDLLTLRTSIGTIPYNDAGYSLIETALLSTIEQGLSFGAWTAGVTLSGTQIAEVNEAAGMTIAPTLSSQGYYLQISSPSPSVRQARGSPPMTFWYVDGESIQSMTLSSIDVQ